MITRRPPPRQFSIRRPEVIGMMGAYQLPPMAGDPEPVAAPGERPSVPQAPAPGPAGPRPAPRRSSFLDSRGFRVFDRVFGGQTITEARDAEDARQAQAERMAQVEAVADELGLEGRERLAFMVDPEKWAANFAKPAEAQTIEGPDGIYERGPDGWRRVADYPAQPERLVFGDFGGPEGVPDGVPDVGYDSDVRAQLDARRRGQPAAAPQGLPPIPEGFRPVNPTEAPSPGGAAPQGFSGYDDLRGFVSGQVPGARFTSGYRSQAEQDALLRRGVTRARRSAHTYGMGQDFVPPGSPDQWGPIADQLRRSGRFRKVLIERGGPGQGTGPHIHVEPY